MSKPVKNQNLPLVFAVVALGLAILIVTYKPKVNPTPAARSLYVQELANTIYNPEKESVNGRHLISPNK